jgi:hypothetical protein
LDAATFYVAASFVLGPDGDDPLAGPLDQQIDPDTVAMALGLAALKTAADNPLPAITVLVAGVN